MEIGICIFIEIVTRQHQVGTDRCPLNAQSIIKYTNLVKYTLFMWLYF